MDKTPAPFDTSVASCYCGIRSEHPSRDMKGVRTEMPKNRVTRKLPEPRWMTECDVIRYNLQMPEKLKKQLKKEAEDKDMGMSTYICGLLSGDIKRKKPRK
jgi:hypothetical protein